MWLYSQLYLGSGPPQSPPMPEKQPLSQVVPGATRFIGHGGLYVCTPGGYQIEVGMDLKEQVLPTG